MKFEQMLYLLAFFALIISSTIIVGQEANEKNLLDDESQIRLGKIQIEFLSMNATSQQLEQEMEDYNVRDVVRNSWVDKILSFLVFVEMAKDIIGLIFKIIFIPSILFNLLGVSNVVISMIINLACYILYGYLIKIIWSRIS